MNVPMPSFYFFANAPLPVLFLWTIGIFIFGQSISLLYRRRFGGQIKNGPVVSFFFLRLRDFVSSNFCFAMTFSFRPRSGL